MNITFSDYRYSAKDFRVEINTKPISERFARAQYYLDSQIMNDMRCPCVIGISDEQRYCVFIHGYTPVNNRFTPFASFTPDKYVFTLSVKRALRAFRSLTALFKAVFPVE